MNFFRSRERRRGGQGPSSGRSPDRAASEGDEGLGDKPTQVSVEAGESGMRCPVS